MERAHVNDLIERVGRGDTRALGELYEGLGGKLYYIALGVVGDRAFAEDVLHDAFLALARGAPSFRKDNGEGYLCTIVRNTALNALKRERLRAHADLDALQVADAENGIAAAEARTEAGRALAALEDRERRAVLLKYYADLPVRQIAGILGIGKSTAQRIIAAAEEKMAQVLLRGEEVKR